MTEGPTPRDPREEPGPHDAPRWESPGTPPPQPPPPPPPPPGQGWGQQPGGHQGSPPGGPYGGQTAGSGMAENVASGLSYVLTWLTGLLFLLVDRRPEVRFHAVQSIAYGVLWTLVAVIRPVLPSPLGALLGLVLFGFFVGWIVLMIQGFQGRHFKLPVLGDFAEQQAGRPRP